jgi:hypothetical protein
MRLFRSEEQVRGEYPAPGAIFPAAQLWLLARAWYGDRLAPDWGPRTPADSQQVLHEAGLRGSFWRLG